MEHQCRVVMWHISRTLHSENVNYKPNDVISVLNSSFVVGLALISLNSSRAAVHKYTLPYGSRCKTNS